MSDEKIIHLNENAIKGELKELVRSSVEKALIEMYPCRCFSPACGGYNRSPVGY